MAIHSECQHRFVGLLSIIYGFLQIVAFFAMYGAWRALHELFSIWFHVTGPKDLLAFLLENIRVAVALVLGPVFLLYGFIIFKQKVFNRKPLNLLVLLFIMTPIWYLLAAEDLLIIRNMKEFWEVVEFFAIFLLCPFLGLILLNLQLRK